VNAMQPNKTYLNVHVLIHAREAVKNQEGEKKGGGGKNGHCFLLKGPSTSACEGLVRMDLRMFQGKQRRGRVFGGKGKTCRPTAMRPYPKVRRKKRCQVAHENARKLKKVYPPLIKIFGGKVWGGRLTRQVRGHLLIRRERGRLGGAGGKG